MNNQTNLLNQYQVAQISIRLQILVHSYPELANLPAVIPKLQNFISLDDAFIIPEMEAINNIINLMETNNQHLKFDELSELSFRIKNLMNNILNINQCPRPSLASYGSA